MQQDIVPFSKPELNNNAQRYVSESLRGGLIAGDGPFTQRCHDWLRRQLGAPTLLTHSCTGSLEMAALLANIGPGDEVLMPSYTFVSTANAFVLRGAKPVFIDIRADTQNMDERLLEEACTARTRAIVPVHYAGVACDMDAILSLAASRDLIVIEDAAQGYGATYRGRSLGTLGALGCLSFHVSKNIVSGEGGALIVNHRALLERANIIREKGTNRTAFLDRKVGKYEWLDIGSSYLPSDILAALLLAQLEQAEHITARRLSIWNRYHDALASAEVAGVLRRPVIPEYAGHNAHIYYVLLADRKSADWFRDYLGKNKVGVLTHYVPLHSAPAGLRFGRTAGSMSVTDRTADTLVRISLYPGMDDWFVDRIITVMLDAIERIS
jgi:dTDP-4-amino-4,6-dideoxygalactose transaminase